MDHSRMAEHLEEKKKEADEGNRRQVQGWMSLLWFERPCSDIAFIRGSGYPGQPPSDEPSPADLPARKTPAPKL